jgi:hypothetical protein
MVHKAATWLDHILRLMEQVEGKSALLWDTTQSIVMRDPSPPKALRKMPCRGRGCVDQGNAWGSPGTSTSHIAIALPGAVTQA